MNEEKNGSNYWYKSARIKLSYYLHSVRGGWKFLHGVSGFLFLVSMAMFLLIIFPELGLRLHESQLLTGGRPTSLTLKGIIQERTSTGKAAPAVKPASGIVVEIGGFRTYSHNDGSYEIQFISKTRNSIPIVLQKGKKQVVIRIDFNSFEDQIRKDITIPDGK